MKHGKLISGVLAGVMAAACVTAVVARPADDARSRSLTSEQCLSQPLENTKVIDERTLLMVDRSGRGALVTMANICLERNEGIILKYFGAGRICSANDVDITGGLQTMRTPCLTDSIAPLNKEQTTAYLNAKDH